MGYIRFLGHASFEIFLANIMIYIDPFFGNEFKGYPRLISSAISAEEINNADLIFITHEHPSHCEKSTITQIVERTSALVVAPKPVLAQLNIPEKFKVDVRIGDKFFLKSVDIEVVKAAHPQSLYPVGYIIKNEKAIYHAGDTYEFSEMRNIEADYSLLPIGGSYTMDPFSGIKACKEMRTRYVIPMHYNTYEKIKQDVSKFVEGLTKTTPIILKVGEKIEL